MKTSQTLDLTKIKFTSYCWSVGTTSFRTKEFALKIEFLLKYLDEFWQKNSGEKWQSNKELQAEFYDFLHDKQFLTGNASKKDKDARQKTSGLVDIGLIDDARHLTEVGKFLLEKINQGNFNTDNIFNLEADNYLYFLQLLKMHSNDFDVHPFAIVIKALCELDYLTQEEFTYLLPLVLANHDIYATIDDIKKVRESQLQIDDIIIKKIWSMENYQTAFAYFKNNPVTLDTFTDKQNGINMNRKGNSYEQAYFPLYNALYEIFINGKHTSQTALKLLTAINAIKGKAKISWKSLLFIKNKATEKAIKKYDFDKVINTKIFAYIDDEISFKKWFYQTTHLFKWQATLVDYYDLNKRYFQLSGLLSFEDSQIKLNILAQEFFNLSIDNYLKNITTASKQNFIELEALMGDSYPNIEEVFTNFSQKYKVDYQSKDDVNNFIKNENLKRFKKIIAEKYSTKTLIELMDCFANRSNEDEKRLKQHITEDATIPTLFEYVLAIAWYKMSDYEGNILDFMKLSLDADLLPKSHAVGGDADIVYSYQQSENYPKHDLLLEATLATSTGQRSMELEPVSRHLAHSIHKNHNTHDYAILVTNKINPMLVSDFRMRKTAEFFIDFETVINGMKILPLDTNIIKILLKNNIRYAQIYQLIEERHQSELPLKQWYDEYLQKFSLLDKFSTE